MTKRKQGGFTLIELLVVIGILAVLLAIVLIAINPARQFSQANDAKRASDVNAILNAIHQYGADNKGNLTALAIPDDTSLPAARVISAANGFGPLCTALVPTYIAALPVDPLQVNGASTSGAPILPADCEAVGATWSTLYSVFQSANGRITVSATSEIDPTVSISVLR